MRRNETNPHVGFHSETSTILNSSMIVLNVLSLLTVLACGEKDTVTLTGEFSTASSSEGVCDDDICAPSEFDIQIGCLTKNTDCSYDRG